MSEEREQVMWGELEVREDSIWSWLERKGRSKGGRHRRKGAMSISDIGTPVLSWKVAAGRGGDLAWTHEVMEYTELDVDA